ncbi:MAG TPA: uroporphyrinogen-III synthase [Xanthobacteraceae bacterium]|nr:uroporphyrinogen-III synthase [Xanthobacteraceae bacterium]
MRLLVTRPEDEGRRTAEMLRALGHEVLLAPLLRIEPIPDADFGPPPWPGVLMSSANAARAVAAHPRKGELVALPLLAVGDRTAEAAREAGFMDVTSAGGEATDLARAAATRFAGCKAPLLYLAGRDRARDLPAALGELRVRTVVVYRAIKVERLPSAVQAALAAGRLDGVLHYSRRSAETYLALADAAGLRAKALAPLHYCLSARIAAALADAPEVRIAAEPNEAALLRLIAGR